jgi:ring-1,2-phenylacetyl-CoA epoxidase subunit PaaD
MNQVADLIPLLPEEEMARRLRRANSLNPELWDLLDAVMDPEIPVITLYELGVLQNVELRGDSVYIVMTPTYIGCPAMTVMEEDARAALAQAGYLNVEVETRLGTRMDHSLAHARESAQDGRLRRCRSRW